MSRPKASPYCDCRELNLIKSTISKLAARTPDDPDTSHEMHLTELNGAKNCKHCNYCPVWLTPDAFKALYHRDAGDSETTKIF